MALILWIDDEPYFLEGHKLALEDAGYNVEFVENEALALSRIKQQPSPSLIILDIIMPGDLDDPGPDNGMSTGVHFLEQVAKEKILKIPIIVLTIIASQETHKRINEIGKQFGKLIVLVKPILPSELIDEVRTLIPDTSAAS